MTKKRAFWFWFWFWVWFWFWFWFSRQMFSNFILVSHTSLRSNKVEPVKLIKSSYHIEWFLKTELNLKDTSVFATGGGNARIFWLQNALSQDWSVVWCSNLFRLTLWTLPALFGAHTPPKSMCTQRHTRLKNFDEKMHFFAVKLVWAPGGVPNVKIAENLSIKAQSPQKSIYSIPTHLKSIWWP